MLVSLCMIMKNEEEELPLVLTSAAGLADEIVIYDTGSTDRSVTLARELGARVIEGYWDEDFSRARNEALKYCSGEWILWLDADEAVHGDKAALRARLARERIFDAYAVAIECLEGTGLSGRMAFVASRVFRRQRCRWYGPVHEQVGDLDSETSPPTTNCSELRILHRGYTNLKAQSKDLIERNLRIARQAVADPEVEHSRALYDYGRTLVQSEDPSAAVAPLRQAAELTKVQMVRRSALRTIFDVYLSLAQYDQASAVIAELRPELTKPLIADVMEVRLFLAKRDFAACLEAVDRLPFTETDEDGFEVGRASLAWAKAQALDALGRPDEAADVVLDALRTHGQIDLGLGTLVRLLAQAGRSVAEVAEKARPESMAVLVAAASLLAPEQADETLAAFAERYPDRLEPLAAACEVASKLSVPRAMWWSNRLRRAGHAEMCPLLAIVRDETLEPSFRLLTAAGGYLSFRDQRLVPPARAVLGSMASGDRPMAIEQVAGISPDLAKLLRVSTQAVQLSRRGTALEGYLAYSTRAGTVGGHVECDALPLGAGVVHDLVTEDVLSSVPHDRAGAVLLEWARVTCDGAQLRLAVPNLAAVGGLLARGASAELRRLLFGGRRFGDEGAEEANADAWTREELEATLSSIGFLVEDVDDGPLLKVSARRSAVVSRQATTAVLPVSVLVTACDGSEDMLAQLRALSLTESGVDFETVVLVNGPDDGSRSLCAAVEGDVTTAASPLRLDPSAAVDEAARLARAETIVVVSRRARPLDGWLARLIAPLQDPSVALSCAAVVDEGGLVVHAGYELVGDAESPNLEALACSAYLRAESALSSQVDVDAAGAEAFAMRRELWDELRGLRPGWSEQDAVIDLSLRARAQGLRCVVAADCAVRADPPDEDKASRERLAWHWAGRTTLRPAPVARVSASSLMPSSTLIERVSSVMAVPSEPRPGGVNLVGDFEDSRVRAYAAAFSGAGIPISRLSWCDGAPNPFGVEAPFAYVNTLLALDGDQLVDYIAEVGIDTLRDRRTIIAWEWPISQPSSGAGGEATMVGEIWVPSSFAERALKRVAPRPLFLMPPPVVAPRDVSRADAGLPDGFVFAAVARLGRGRPGDEALANPVGAIEAFKEAFAPGSGPVLCVVLVGRKLGAAGESCRVAADGRNDVRVIETDDCVLADAASVTADCLISLHRASSFGADLARAMLVGCPVVATSYGGPMDFLTDEYAELVPYTLSASKGRAFPFPAGTEWAEPDIEAAGAALRVVHDDLSGARRKAWLGRAVVMRRCGPKSASRALRRRLGESPFAPPQSADRHRLGAAR